MNDDIVRQVRIVHLSDLHFGDHHRFQPPATPGGDIPSRRGYPTLLDSLRTDWASTEWQSPEWASEGNDYPLIVAITGDLTEGMGDTQANQVEDFVNGIGKKPILDAEVNRDTVFMVPGNHDVVFEEETLERRWQPYCSMYAGLFGFSASAKSPQLLTRVHDLSDSFGLVVIEVNSSAYVKKGSPDEKRGLVDEKSLAHVRDHLKEIPEDRLLESVKVCLVHHHPIVLPALAEPGQGYDAIVNSDKLLGILQEFGFHLILHGHKHYPHTFSYDAVCAWTDSPIQPIMVVAGGSVGSRQLPRSHRFRNTYNMVIVKWHPKARQARIRIVTRALVTWYPQGQPALAADWHWETIRVDDRRLPSYLSIPQPTAAEPDSFSKGSGAVGEASRTRQYAKLRGNMPVVEVMPSLRPGQAYQAMVWIVGHNRASGDIPTRVTWSAGPKFNTVTVCDRARDVNFCASFNYWGPMLVQARMQFEDGTSTAGYVYARIPGQV